MYIALLLQVKPLCRNNLLQLLDIVDQAIAAGLLTFWLCCKGNTYIAPRVAELDQEIEGWRCIQSRGQQCFCMPIVTLTLCLFQRFSRFVCRAMSRPAICVWYLCPVEAACNDSSDMYTNGQRSLQALWHLKHAETLRHNSSPRFRVRKESLWRTSVRSPLDCLPTGAKIGQAFSSE